MGKITYEQKNKSRNQQRTTINEASAVTKKAQIIEESDGLRVEGAEFKEQFETENNGSSNLKRVNAIELYERLLGDSANTLKVSGDIDTEHVVYIEDYAYTYLYQYAATNEKQELSAILVGETYEEHKETIILGIIPVDSQSLGSDDMWISEKAIKNAIKKRDKYFNGTRIVGWLHMQPGYGTMVSSKEIKVHREFFKEKSSLLLLVDPINKVETFFVYDEETLKEQTGFYLFYEKNVWMHEYMLDNPLIDVENKYEDSKDKAVRQFREIGSKRKKEYDIKQKSNFSLVAGCLAIVALGAVFTRFATEETELGAPTQPTWSPGANSETEEPNIIEQKYVIENTNPITTAEAPTTSLAEVEPINVTTTDNSIPPIVVDTQENERTAELNIPEPNIDIPTEIEDNIDSVALAETIEKEETVPAESDEVQSTDDYEVYTVESGDSIRSISKHYFGHENYVHEILGWNDIPISDGDKIHVGQELKIHLNAVE
ncbi:hypothetical protein AN641_05460 [Candidatus Epulonipiscioides gigas]|nr:hypothetical protein AN641_05460 [Epulopiscium sp. SCG-C07WGA-EpuloA2]